ncbi:MAG: YgfZ/GcvT domain-containing protein [Rhodopirellula sp. JB044]|uniref:CAF17-like 4Fe-4S cluster assembly/insertion protein YgfZ n=1 Tax=Rhodopirellula sp. JB044 TaxID=3342844 RepID=UPI00370B6268
MTTILRFLVRVDARSNRVDAGAFQNRHKTHRETVLILRMPSLTVLDLLGKDATAILHNLTTNEIKTLEPDGPGVESFITNVKGKCVGHVLVYRTVNGFRLIGAGGQAEAIAMQMDKYTIREDAVPHIRDTETSGWLVVSDAIAGLFEKSDVDSASSLCRAELPMPPKSTEPDPADASPPSLTAYCVPWAGLADTGSSEISTANPAGRGALILSESSASLSTTDVAHAVQDALQKPRDVLEVINDAEAESRFHQLRIAAGYPWHGVDFGDTHLPQEVRPEEETISFTKGCYLGQETIARLDALGQVQKKLVKWSLEGLDGRIPEVDTKLFAGGEKPVGRLTSISAASSNSGSRSLFALGFARRSHFDVGAEASGTVGEHSFIAKVAGV